MAAISSRFNPLRKLRVTSPPRNDPAIGFPEDHQFNRRLQEGSEGYVEQWTHTASKTMIAVKVVRHSHPYPNEVRILQHLPSHKSIVGYLGYCKKQPYAEKTSILLEYCSEGDLFTLMNAIAFLHEGIDDQHRRGRDEWRPIVYRDVKFENVLVKNLGSKDDWSDIEVKLGDFGMAGYHDPKNPSPRGHIGTTHYWPPEVTWENKRLGPASDVWSAATIIHELAHNFGPLVDPKVIEKKWFLQNDKAPYLDSWPENLKKNYWSSKAPRRPIPINIEPSAPISILTDEDLGYDKQALAFRQCRPSPKYSDALSDCMMAGLAMSPEERPESGQLLREIETAHADVLFQDLCLAHKRETINAEDEDIREDLTESGH
ncbi:unnamed protein product [Alternaria alternata]